jgi:hypothetical protein
MRPSPVGASARRLPVRPGNAVAVPSWFTSHSRKRNVLSGGNETLASSPPRKGSNAIESDQPPWYCGVASTALAPLSGFTRRSASCPVTGSVVRTMSSPSVHGPVWARTAGAANVRERRVSRERWSMGARPSGGCDTARREPRGAWRPCGEPFGRNRIRPGRSTSRPSSGIPRAGAKTHSNRTREGSTRARPGVATANVPPGRRHALPNAPSLRRA